MIWIAILLALLLFVPFCDMIIRIVALNIYSSYGMLILILLSVLTLESLFLGTLYFTASKIEPGWILYVTWGVLFLSFLFYPAYAYNKECEKSAKYTKGVNDVFRVSQLFSEDKSDEEILQFVTKNGEHLYSKVLERALLYERYSLAQEAINNGVDLSGSRFLYEACASTYDKHRVEKIQFLLDNGANVNYLYLYRSYKKITPLMIAAEHEDTTVVALLLKNNADTRIQDSQGKTVYDYAEKHPEIMKLLKQHDEMKQADEEHDLLH